MRPFLKCPDHRGLSRVLPHLCGEGVHLERYPPGKPQPAALPQHGRRRPEDRPHGRSGLWPDRLGQARWAAADPGRHRAEELEASRPGDRKNPELGLPRVSELCPLQGRRGHRGGRGLAGGGTQRAADLGHSLPSLARLYGSIAHRAGY